MAAGLAACLLAGGASAETITYFLTQTNDTEGHLPDGAHDYVSVTLSDGVDAGNPGDVDVTVTIGPLLLGIPDLNFGINNFYFNSTAVLTAANIANEPATWSTSFDYDTGPPHQTGNGMGRFEVRLFPNTGPDRVSPSLTFSITGIAGDTIADYALLSTNTAETTFFAVQVAGFVDQDPLAPLDPIDDVGLCREIGEGNYTPECNILNSIWAGGTNTTPIPEPGTGLLVGLGLLALAVRRSGRA